MSDNHSENKESTFLKKYFSVIASFILLVICILIDNFFDKLFANKAIRFASFTIAYLPVALPVLREAASELRRGSFFNEFSLMSIATLGAFVIAQYPEAVAVMLFYSVGEILQDKAVETARGNIKSLLDVRPAVARVFRNGEYQTVAPETVLVGEQVQIFSGEKAPLDGVMLTDRGSFNTSALTGESLPRTVRCGETVLAGMLNTENVIEIQVTKPFNDSSLAKIIHLTQNATERKAKTELLIRRFAKIYTPIVFAMAMLITCVPMLFAAQYNFSQWLYRGLVFLVISCPCALVISIPLGYFAGIGAASRNGILFKGAHFLDLLRKINAIVFDKTGTLTKGVFRVQNIVCQNIDKQEFIAMTAAVEQYSNHPIAKAIVEYAESLNLNYNFEIQNVEELAGYGVQCIINSKKIAIGNKKLMQKCNIQLPNETETIVETVTFVAIDHKFAGYAVIADEIKDSAAQTISDLRQNNVNQIIMLSGDKLSIVEKTARQLNICDFRGDLLPENKVEFIDKLKQQPGVVVAFVGDGINDAPSLALADAGIAMGGIGSDLAIEVADVVVQTDQPAKIVSAISIANKTHTAIMQNLFFAIAVKIAMMILGTLGFANMWAAVFADVGVSLLCVLNAVRTLKTDFN
ncbi:MAG: cadmium-translocating P-type ATPase [Prevotellaceae bacterium]|jgi:Cd2+/Zn2+-exporting ATPase|nr:cadmium-translocating P-type ATPase [Prevotellaceae bacterium]